MGIGGIGGPRGPVGWPADDDDGAASPPPLPLPAPGGIDLFPRSVLLPRPDEQASANVKTLGDAASAGLEDAARRNTTGPEARLLARIRAETQDALRSIRADEAELGTKPAGCPSRRPIEERIDARARRFRNDIALATLRTADEIKARGKKEEVAAFARLLPSFLREVVERGGVSIPGVPGAFRPRADDGILRGPTGIDYRVDF